MSKVFSSSSQNNTIIRKDHTTWCLMFRESAQNQEFEAFKSSQTNLAAFTIMFTLFTGIFFFFVYIVVHQHKTKSDLVWPMLISLIVTGLVGIASISLKTINSFYKNTKLHRTTAISNYLDSIFVFGASATICFFILNKVNNGACSDINGGFIETLCCVAERPRQMPEALMIVAAMQPAIISTVAKGAKWSVILLTYCFVMIMMFFTIFHYDLTESAMTLLIFAPFSFLILYEKQRQSISLFLLTQSQKNLLEENERLAAETHANELRHMIGNVAHDLKTPLSAFINGVDLIMGILDEIGSIQESQSSHSRHSTSLKAMLDTVKETAINMKNVNDFMLMTINRCIDYTKASNGHKLVPRLETVSLAETINLPLGCMRNMDSRIAIKMSPISEDVATHIITDKQWLQENILCLLSNAVKYSAGGEVNVSVSLSADVKFLVLEVEDTGIGIEEEVRANLFNQFKQAQRLAGGTGLGLYSLAKRVEALGGTYGVGARKDGKQGSLFWYTIPYRPDLNATVATILLPSLQGTQIPNSALKADELSTSERTGSRRLKKTFMQSMSEPNPHKLLGTAEVSMANTPTQSTPREGNKKLNILLVDDSLSIIKMSSMMLRRQGHTVTTADNGAVALRILTELMMAQNNSNSNNSGGGGSSSVLFDVVLMDLQMPIMDGLEATSRLRKEESLINSSSGRSYHQMVIGVSACSDFETMEAAFAAGIDEFIPKPFNIQSFNDTYGKLQNREQLLVGTS